MDELKLEDLAGATLDRVAVDWRNGIVLVTLLNVKDHESCALRATEFSRVEVPRSASASKIVKAATRSGDTLVLSMESGEALHVQSARFAIDVLGG